MKRLVSVLISILFFAVAKAGTPVKISGDTLICSNFYYTYSIRNKPPVCNLNWEVSGGQIVGNATNDSITVLWLLKSKTKYIKLYLDYRVKNKIVRDSINLNVKQLKIEGYIKGKKKVLTDSRNRYSLKLTGSINPDYINWKVGNNKYGNICSYKNTDSINVQWHYTSENVKTYIICEAVKCNSVFSAAVPIIIFGSSSVKEIKHKKIETRDGLAYRFTCITKGNKASKYIWNFNDGILDTTNTSVITHRFYGISDSIHEIYVQVIDSTNSLLSKVFAKRIIVNKKTITSKPDEKIPAVYLKIFCASQNKAYTLKIGTIIPPPYLWSINGKTYKQREIYIDMQPADTLNVFLTKNGETIYQNQIATPHLPVAAYSFKNNKLKHFSVCEGNSFILENKSNGKRLNYWWDFNDGTYSRAANPYKSYYSKTVFYLYYITLIATDEYGCSDTTTDHVAIRNNTIQPIMLKFRPNVAKVYSDSTYAHINIEPLFIGGQPPLKFQWYRESELLINDTNRILKYGINKNTYYYLKITDSNGCYKYLNTPPARTQLIINTP